MAFQLTFVIPWFDPAGSTGGGAESLCREYAARLAATGHDVEVLTTCSRDHDADWYSDAYPAGRITAPEGYAVERFPVRPASRGLFLDLNRRILHGQRLSYREERAFLENSISSDALLAAARQRLPDRMVIALPYLFGLTWRLLSENPGKVVLWPCLHDEGYAHLKLLAETHRRARALIYNSTAEAELAAKLYAPAQPSAVLGMGVSWPESDDEPPGEAGLGERAAAPYFLYLGRQSPEKGVDHLVRIFRIFAAGRDELVQLVLAGKGSEARRVLGETIVNRGFVSEVEKEQLLRGAVALVMPSVRESFSLVLLEALARGVPALVNGGCEVTRTHVRAGQCGLWYSSAEEFAECANLLLEEHALRETLGENGRRYVRQNFRWEQKVEQLVSFLSGLREKVDVHR